MGIALGAFGAHGLKMILSSELMAVFQTAVTYQMWHSFALILIALMMDMNIHSNTKLLVWAARLIGIGIVFFSGSLYFLAVFNCHWLGVITPIGGISFLMAWLLIFIFSLKGYRK